MNCPIYCPQTRHDCSSPWVCGDGCNFNNEVVPKQSAQERAAAKFWEPDLPVQFVGPEPDEAVKPDAADVAIAWMQRRAKHVLWVSVAIGLGIYFWGRS